MSAMTRQRAVTTFSLRLQESIDSITIAIIRQNSDAFVVHVENQVHGLIKIHGIEPTVQGSTNQVRKTNEPNVGEDSDYGSAAFV